MTTWSEGPAVATFDLHGQTVLEGVANAEHFLRVQRRARPGAVVRLITGRGRGGGGAPLRTRVRTRLGELRREGAIVRDYVLEASEGSFLVRLSG
jgi:DNA-nicking Smr family endonuclease